MQKETLTLKRPRVLHPLLVAVYPVLFLYSQNLGEFKVQVVFVPAAALLMVAFGAWWGLGALLRNHDRAALIVSAALLLFFAYGPVYELLWQFLAEHPSALGPKKIALSLYSGMSVVGMFAVWRIRNFPVWTRVANLGAVVLILMPLVSLAVYPLRVEAEPVFRKDDVTTAIPGAGGPDSRPRDIYYIILDAYGRADVLSDLYGYDNSEMIEWLGSRGFAVSSDARANYCQTVLSISSSLNLMPLQTLVPDLDPRSVDRMLLTRAIFENRLFAALQSQGYRTCCVSSGCVYTDIRDADVFTETGTSLVFLDEFQNGLLESTPLPLLLSKLNRLSFISTRIGQFQTDAHRRRVLRQFDEIVQTASQPGPKIVFSHLLVPHAPYVFGPNGEFLEADQIFNLAVGVGVAHVDTAKASVYRERYIGQLRFVNTKVRQMIDAILAVSDSDPIIVIQADHGPGLETDWSDIENTNLRERLGIFCAIRVPDEDGLDFPDAITPIDLWRRILNHYHGTGFPTEESRSYFSSYNTPFQLIDVTDQIRADSTKITGAPASILP